jgi:small subunit ribosomal protein S7e
MSDPSSKICKKGAATDFEKKVASAVLEIETINQDLKQ